MESVDWVSTAMVDCFWWPLLHPSSLLRWREEGWPSPLHCWWVVTSLCKSTHRPASDLFDMVDRPYLDQSPAEHARQAVLADLCLRRFVADVERASACLSVPAIVAGEFAAWRLERRMDSFSGNDGLPRVERTVRFRTESGADVWGPNHVDVFVQTEEPAVALALVEGAFHRYHEGIWSKRGGALSCFFTPKPDEFDEEKEKSDEHVLTLFERELRSLGTSPIDVAFATTQRANAALADDAIVTKSGLFAFPRAEPLSPSALRIWRCSDASRVPVSLFLAHCGVEASVRGGEWHFSAPRACLDALQSRMLRAQSVSPHNWREDAVAIKTYLSLGFSFRGDAFRGTSFTYRMPRVEVTSEEQTFSFLPETISA